MESIRSIRPDLEVRLTSAGLEFGVTFRSQPLKDPLLRMIVRGGKIENAKPKSAKSGQYVYAIPMAGPRMSATVEISAELKGKVLASLVEPIEVARFVAAEPFAVTGPRGAVVLRGVAGKKGGGLCIFPSPQAGAAPAGMIGFAGHWAIVSSGIEPGAILELYPIRPGSADPASLSLFSWQGKPPSWTRVQASVQQGCGGQVVSCPYSSDGAVTLFGLEQEFF